MQTLARIRQYLDDRGLSPLKRFGQNFLIDHNLIRKLVDASGVGPGSLVLEVGPGTGTMTEELLERGCEVVACELDHGLASLLRDVVGGGVGGGRFTLVEGDCLASKHALSSELIGAIGNRPFTLVSNLPYGAATPLLTTLLSRHRSCRVMAVTIQREVADRLSARPGSRDYGPISVVAQASATIEHVATLPPECFWPRPDVTSAMVMLTRLNSPLTDDLETLELVCRDLFSRRRKQIGWFMSTLTHRPAGIETTMRPEELTPPQFVQLARSRRSMDP
ncbi:MAG: ribosomal RNA small subunit methyltransferase A [Phycisphaeraceae bacterium]|nr:ribosomal RNA small subunit methyltransferase A [Phycisphaerae bacterium]MBX3392262.1 ribosomal RNA small subunit methyltransferase A [Phycisphaeraceae bacterium]HRJ49219.1 16S rRNA (adenine(1518)-N(6)/adenine(1519)-N(6))-dimethyltransferase RsmA [Phycisphaerales bacterium]